MELNQLRLKKIITIYLSCYLVFSPLLTYGATLQVDGSTQTSIVKARNDVPVVNIADPNASGLSHNKFTHYNVNTEGLILNNARTSTVNTQLGGYIYGNAQLKSNASVILNEVSSTNRSSLNGYTEIAGQRADLVIANPNGLTINGAGFINTSNITLTTGTPHILNGSLDSLSVNGGDIAIEGMGLNTQNQDSTNIYTHYLKLNAKLHAQNLDIKLGRNQLDYLNHTITSSTNSNNTQALLLDTSALGGMYANRIALVGTDKGLGVNMPPEVLASVSDITITNDGHISLQKVTAKQRASFAAAGDIRLDDNLYAGSRLSLHAGKEVVINRGVTAAKDSIIVNSEKLTNQGTLFAGLTENNTQNTNGAVAITADVVVNDGQLQSTRDLTVTASSLNNRQLILVNNNLTMEIANELTNSGSMHANNANRMTTASLVNSGNITATSILDITGGQLISTAGEVSATNVTINADSLTSTATNILAGDDLTLNVTGAVVNAGTNGSIQAGNKLVLQNANSLTNENLMVANSVAIAAAQTIQNDGILHADSALSLTAADVSNTQQISSDGSLFLNVANRLDNSNATITALGNTDIYAATLDNSKGSFLTNSNHNILASATLINRGGLIKSNLSSKVQAPHLDNANGTVEAVQDLTLDAATIALTDSTLYAGNDFSLTMNTLDNIASSAIGAGNNLIIDAVSGVTNSADLLANGDLVVNTDGAFTNNKTISSGGALQIKAATLDNNLSGTLSGGIGASNIQIGGSIINLSRVSAIENLTVEGTDISNDGFFNAGNDLTLISTDLTNNKTLFAGNDMNLYTAGTLNNNPYANIFAVNNLKIAASDSNDKAGIITNNEGAQIETLGGDIEVYANSLNNTTGLPVVQGSYVAGPPESIVDGANVSNEVVSIGCGANCRDDKTTRVDIMALTSTAAPAIINSGGNLSLNADNITNQYSLISATQNIHLDASVVDNLPVELFEVTTVTTAMYRNAKYCKRRVFGVCINSGYRMEYRGTTTNTSSRILDTVAATIQAGGSLTGHVANFSNANIKENQPIETSTQLTQETSNTLNGKLATNTTIMSGAGPDISSRKNIQIPVDSYGLFILSSSPQSQYLIETNPEFTLYNNFISSDYMMQQIDFSADRTLKRVGDAFYENRLIRDSIFEQTGRRFLASDLQSDYAQYQYLMDNALRAHEDLELIPGVSLTYAQIAALKQDIVWLEEQVVAGQRVLVPVVYIVGADEYKIEGGKIIAGDDINLLVGQLNNGGLLEAGGDMNIEAADSITNKGGSISAGETMGLSAKNDIKNISATIKARNISLVASDGSIGNERFTRDVLLMGANYKDANTQIGEAGRVEATENLALSAGQKITNAGSTLKAQQITLNAEQVDITTTVHTSDFFGGNSKNYIKEQSLTNLASEIEGDNIRINSSGITTIEGSHLKAKQDLNISAGQLDVLAVNDSRSTETKFSEDGFLKKSSTLVQHATSTNVSSSLSAGNISVTSTAGDQSGDINLIGSSVAAAENIDLNAAGNINIMAGYDVDHRDYKKTTSSLFSGANLMSATSDNVGSHDKDAVGSEIVGANINMTAKGTTLEGAEIAAENIRVVSQKIDIGSAKEEHQSWETHEKMNVSLGNAFEGIATAQYDLMTFQSDKLFEAEVSYSKTQTTAARITNQASTLQASHDLSLATHEDDIRIEGSRLEAGDNLTLDSAKDVNILAAQETSNSSYKETSGQIKTSLSISAGMEADINLRLIDNGQDKSLAQGAMLTSGADLRIKSVGDTNVIGAEIKVQGNTSLETGGDINVAAAENRENEYVDTVDLNIHSGGIPKISLGEGQVEAELGKATLKKVKSTTNTTRVTMAIIESGENIDMDSQESINIEGSNLTAGADINLIAAEDVSIKEAKETDKLASKTLDGEATVKFVVKNEYVKIAYAVKNLKDASEALKDTKEAYNQFKNELSSQKTNLAQLKIAFANEKIGIEQVDIDELEELISDLKEDDTFYIANIALAAISVAAQTTALVTRITNAAASSGTYGFSAGLDIDIDAIEEKLKDWKEYSVATNMSANNINITAGEKATIQGSKVTAQEALRIAAQDSDILASKENNNRTSSRDHQHVTLSIGTSGASISASADSTQSRSAQTQGQNAQLSADNITLNIRDNTSIEGANLTATDNLDITTKNLAVSAVQNTSISKTYGVGMSLTSGSEISSVGANVDKSRARSKETILTTLTGNRVNIKVEEETSLKGSTIAAVERDTTQECADSKDAGCVGVDNGQLTLTTGTLNVSSLNNTNNTKSLSAGVTIGQTSSIDFANNNSNSKTKVLGTLGSGNIQIANEEDSNTRMLNRDINDSEIDIYSIESHKGLKAEIDIRMLSEEGRAEIAKDFKESGKNMQVVAQGLPEANNSNVVIALIGKGLDYISDISFGIIPSNGENGGLLGETPILLGARDINAGVFQARKKDDPYVKNHPDDFIPIELVKFYDGLPQQSKDLLKGTMVTKRPVEYTADNALAQSFGNGQSNTLPEAVVNGMQQTGADAFNVRFNPSHGGIADTLESAVDTATPITTGMAKEFGENRKIITQTNQETGIRSNFADHSQANSLDNKGAKYIGGDINLPSSGTADERQVAKIYGTVIAYGSPVSHGEIEDTSIKAGLIFSGSHVNEGDGVASVLGGNVPGTDESASGSDRVTGLMDLRHNIFGNKYGENPSGHSTYECKANCGNNADLTPEQLAQQRKVLK